MVIKPQLLTFNEYGFHSQRVKLKNSPMSPCKSLKFTVFSLFIVGNQETVYYLFIIRQKTLSNEMCLN